MTLFQAMIERHAQELVLAETNKAAVIIEGTGNKIQWSGVIAEAVKRLIATHSTLTETQAVNMVNAVMLKTTGIGPMDLKEVSDGRGDANPDGAVQGAVPGPKFTPGEATGGVSEVRGPIVNRSDPGLNIGGSGKGGGSGEVGAPDLHNQYR
jgi:hypothetical protein